MGTNDKVISKSKVWWLDILGREDHNGFYYVEGNVSLGEVKIGDYTKEINIVLGPNASLTIEKLVIYTLRKDNQYILNVYRECPETGEFSSEGSFTIDELKHYHTDAGSVIISYTPELHVYGGIVSVGSFTNYHYYTDSSSCHHRPEAARR